MFFSSEDAEMFLCSDPHSRPSRETGNTAAIQGPAPGPQRTLPSGCLSLTITQSNLLCPAARFYEAKWIVSFSSMTLILQFRKPTPMPPTVRQDGSPLPQSQRSPRPLAAW